MSEKNLWQRLRKGLAPHLELQRLEDRYSIGVPDLLYAGDKDAMCGSGVMGVIELKFLQAWPKRSNTPVLLRKFRKEQKLWLKRFGSLTDLAWLLLQVGRNELLLFDWNVAQDLGQTTRLVMCEDAILHFSGPMDAEDYAELARVLTK